MAYVRAKTIKGRRYYYLVEGVRYGKKVRQKVVRYLGKVPVPLVRVSRRLELEEPVAEAVIVLAGERPVSSGFQTKLNRRWTIVFEGKVSARVAWAAREAGLEVRAREASRGTGHFLSDVSLPGVPVTQVTKAQLAFGDFAAAYMRWRS